MAILTISREAGSNGLIVGRAVAERMGYVFFDKERILCDLQKDGAEWAKEGREMDEHAPSLWEKYDWRYLGFIALAKSHILECALEGNVVIMGRGGNFLLEGIPIALRARIIAPMSKRLQKVTVDQERRDFVSLNPEAARTLLEKMDRESDNLVRSVYGKSWNDPWAYDVTLNMGGLDVDDATSTLVAMLAKRDSFKSAAVDEELAGRAMSAKIKAAIATDSRFSVPTLEVFRAAEGFVLKGVVHNAREHNLIEEKAKEIAGDLSIKCELHYR
jgi:cytidylate kinase